MARSKATREKVVEEPKTERESSDARFRALAAVAGKSSAFRRPREVLRRVRAVPTIFPGVDAALRVGGWPIDRIATIHGPSNHGKSIFAAGLGISFLQRGHFFKLMDAERTTSITWYETLAKSVGNINLADAVGFSASRPDSYEDAVEEIREWCTAIGEAKAKGQVPADTTGLVVVDSLRKLVPKKFFEKVNNSQKSDGSVDGFGGRAAQMKAALNAAWLDELVPLLDGTGTALIFIARESEDVNADANDKKWGRDFKVTGGKAIIFDASLVIRIERDGWVYGPGPEGAKKPVYGERHRVTVAKTKISGKDDKTQVAHFHTSNGELVPEGFDLARDVLALACEAGVVTKTSGWLSYAKRRWNGDNQAVKWFVANPEALAELEAKVRATFEVEGIDRKSPCGESAPTKPDPRDEEEDRAVASEPS